ncbi:MAG: TIGR04282 family arsenosugar biosynthesis glycosyltransferase [Nisaea sp.]|uniref:TIGR04282 family arsenosugar biosynthesis glycosyltransferase n=1 Tax=Nisaea sp. TaxID=2024842 RepID=UPI001B14F59A|nr:TIGR04282 family arsenosugar biosynthesis glycosyltransferase [Nisaea sp.]MBO6561662.1 TIGR04282 family arsenosugar biosynthesis glycosyltransferase [Nisaea sp.]
MPRKTLIVFAKTPRAGLVKSRLARDIGRHAATRWYRGNLSATLGRLGRGRRWDCRIFGTPHHAAHWPWPHPWRFRHQAPGDLGHRMLRALRSSSGGPVVLIGSDIPGIGPAHIAEAFRKLGSNDAVFGPSADGGYWLVGFSPRYRSDPFRQVRWSTEHALADTLRGFGPGHRIGFVAELRDVDTGADLAAPGT